MRLEGRILVVDDEPSVRLLTVRVLERMGVEVRSAGSAAEALGALDAGPGPDLALVDVRLPDGSGPGLVARLRERVPELRVLYMSGHDAADLEDRGLGLGDDPLLEKPFAIEELAQRVVGLLTSPLHAP